MLSNKEIEKALNNLWSSSTDVMFNVLYSQEEMQEDLKIALKYIKKLETDKQNLIKELETALDFAKTGNDIISKTQVACLENILKIAKGEKYEQSR